MKAHLLIAVVVLVGCTAQREDGDIDIDPAPDFIGDWRGNLEPRNNSGISGSVVLRSALTNAGTSITIWGANEGSRHPWHVHFGSCGENGAIVGDPNAYPVLQIGSNGTASASANIDVGLNEDRTYSVNVHRSPTDLGTIVSCGPLND
ncbi:MAG: hypothetical protein ACT443_12455 [Gemmatimonadota bacterium]